MGGATVRTKNKQNNKIKANAAARGRTPAHSWSSLVYQLCVIASLIICRASPFLPRALGRDETPRNKRQTGRFTAQLERADLDEARGSAGRRPGIKPAPQQRKHNESAKKNKKHPPHLRVKECWGNNLTGIRYTLTYANLFPVCVLGERQTQPWLNSTVHAENVGV